ncbi:hypothetical protein ABH975_006091 [Bradyrhizobium ottawaense]
MELLDEDKKPVFRISLVGESVTQQSGAPITACD